MEYFDSHAHYNDGRFTEEYPGGADAAIRDAYGLGIRYILNAGTNPDTSRESIALAEQYPFMYAAVGLHPEDAMHVPDSDIPHVLADIRTLAAHSKVVAIGEIGLDYHWDPDGRERQIRLFDAQLSLAEELSLPVIVHDRDAHGDAFDTVRAHPGVRGVFHSFSGSADMARQLSMKRQRLFLTIACLSKRMPLIWRPFPIGARSITPVTFPILPALWQRQSAYRKKMLFV